VTFEAAEDQRVSAGFTNVTIASSTVSFMTPLNFIAGHNYGFTMIYFEGVQGASAKLAWSSPSTPEQVIPQSQLSETEGGPAIGVKGEYFDNQWTTGAPVLTRTDPTIDFNWGLGSPDPAIPSDQFSAGWSGYVQAQFSEAYTLCTTTDDGTKLWMKGGILFIDKWINQAPTKWCTSPWTLYSSTTVGTGGKFVEPMKMSFSGTHKIIIDPSDTNTGSMDLTLYDVPPDVAGTVTIGGPALGVTITTPGQNAEVTFEGTIDQQATVHITNNTVSSVQVSLVDSAGFTLTSVGSGQSNFDLPTQTLPATGTYTIKVDPDFARTGSLDVSVTSP
jgi:hypothetical protein